MVVKNYINRLYIDLVGEEPTGTELTDWTSHLFSNGLSQTAREAIVDDLAAKHKYYARLRDLTGLNMLEGADSIYIAEQIYILQVARLQEEANGNFLLHKLFFLKK